MFSLLLLLLLLWLIPLLNSSRLAETIVSIGELLQFYSNNNIRSNSININNTRDISNYGVNTRGISNYGVNTRGISNDGVNTRGISNDGVNTRGISNDGVFYFPTDGQFSVYDGFYIPGGTPIRGKFATGADCRQTCAGRTSCLAADYHRLKRKCYLHTSSTACNAISAKRLIIHYQMAGCGECIKCITISLG